MSGLVQANAHLDERMVGFLAVFGAALSGYAGVNPWAIALAAFALFSSSRGVYSDLYNSRALNDGVTALGRLSALRSALNAVVASGGAYIAGYIVQSL